MNLRRPWLKLALLFCCVAVVSFLVPTTLSFVFSKTDPVVNTFVPAEGILGDAPVEITVVKSVINSGTEQIGPEGFTFTLRNTITGETLTDVSDTLGLAGFNLTYGPEDVGSTFTYEVTEVNDGRAGVTYSQLKYQITVNIAALDNKPVAHVFLDGVETTNCSVRFENIYTAGEIAPPATGDAGHLLMYLGLMVVSAGLLLLMFRRKAHQ